MHLKVYPESRLINAHVTFKNALATHYVYTQKSILQVSIMMTKNCVDLGEELRVNC